LCPPGDFMPGRCRLRGHAVRSPIHWSLLASGLMPRPFRLVIVRQPRRVSRNGVAPVTIRAATRAAELVDRAERPQCAGDVLTDGGLGGLGVAGADRLDDAFVLAEGQLGQGDDRRPLTVRGRRRQRADGRTGRPLAGGPGCR
jgi:hypothetical protein